MFSLIIKGGYTRGLVARIDEAVYGLYNLTESEIETANGAI